MSGEALILTYHAVEDGPPPLCLAPELFAAHLDAIVAAGARTLTVAELAGELREGRSLDGAVALTFDDGFASVAEHAAPAMRARSLRGTVFCVAGHLGGRSDWPGQPSRAPRRALASADQLAELAAAGFEIGAHGVAHRVLAGLHDPAALREEVAGARDLLEERTGAPVTSFAYPYGLVPDGAGRDLVARTYSAACTTALRRAGPDADLHALPRVDAHYLRRPERLARALRGDASAYLRLRRAGARARRAVTRDHA